MNPNLQTVSFLDPVVIVFLIPPQGLVNVALDILSRIHTIPTVPIVDCFQKIRQQVKCYLQLAGVMGKNECMQVQWELYSTIIYTFNKRIAFIYLLTCYLAC